MDTIQNNTAKNQQERAHTACTFQQYSMHNHNLEFDWNRPRFVWVIEHQVATVRPIDSEWNKSQWDILDKSVRAQNWNVDTTDRRDRDRRISVKMHPFWLILVKCLPDQITIRSTFHDWTEKLGFSLRENGRDLIREYYSIKYIAMGIESVLWQQSKWI